MKSPTMSNSVVTKLIVTLFILWTNLGFSIGEDSSGDDHFLGDNSMLDQLSNETGVDWFWESIVVMRWHIGDQPSIEYKDLRFDIGFTVSDYVRVDQHVRYSIYQDAKCENDDNIITDADGYMTSFVTGDDTPVGMGLDSEARRIVTLSNQLNPETIAQSKSYKEVTTKPGIDATITYCVRFSLWTNGPGDSEATEINHVGVTIALNLDLTDDTIKISGQEVGALEQGVETSDDEFFLESFICDPDGTQIVRPFRQGETIRICVQPTEQASEVGFRMKEIGTFSFSQGLISQPAILNGEVATNQLTVLSCEEGSRQCAFETMLFAHFYDSQQGTITGTGDATLQWGGEGVDRRLNISFESLPIHTKNTSDYYYYYYDDNDEFDDSEEDRERSLQDRTSTKSMALADFAVFAESSKRPPLRDKSMTKPQLIVLISLLSAFSVIMLLPMISYFVREPPEPQATTPEIDLAHPEQQQEQKAVNIVDRFVMPGIPEEKTISLQMADDRTIMSVKSLFSRASRVSKGTKGLLVGGSGYATE